MNEKTKQLAIQAGLDDPIFSIDQWENPELKKYTELLVNEHLEVLRHLWYEYNAAPTFPDDTPRDIGIRVGKKAALISAIHRIEQHFGLESVPKLTHIEPY